MKKVKKCIALMLYLFLMAWLFQFDISYLFNLKEIGAVVVGCIILYIPNIPRKEKFKMNWSVFSRSSVFASIIQSFVLLFLTFSTQNTENEIGARIALACRPMLYGICLWGIFSGFEENEASNTPMTSLECNDNEEQIIRQSQINSMDVYKKALEEHGLSRREVEVGLQVISGMSNSEIASVLCITEATVKKHLRNIFQKMKIERRSQLKYILDENRNIAQIKE